MEYWLLLGILVSDYSSITYQHLHRDLTSRSAAELCMPVQALFLDEVHGVKSLRYAWTEDGLVLLTLDCHARNQDEREQQAMTFAQLRLEIGALCAWQLSSNVTIGTKHAIAEVLTIYHAFESAGHTDRTLMLVSTPPDEYFDAIGEAA